MGTDPEPTGDAEGSMKQDVFHGDCLSVLPTFGEESLDAIVTDPPAGIGFMNKGWDHDKGGRDQWIAWMQRVAAECLRVVKPGAHALVWAIPRTSHWTAMAWENAGWEVRDRIGHLHGQGFPKSMNLGCTCNATQKEATSDMQMVPASIQAQKQQGLQQGGDMQLSLQRQVEIQKSGRQRPDETRGSKGEAGVDGCQSKELPGENVRFGKSGLEGRGDLLQEARELQADQVRALPDGVLGDGSQGRVCDGAQASCGNEARTVLVEGGGCTPSEPRPAGQPDRESGTVQEQQRAQASRGGICKSCGGVIGVTGWGTALKPACEDWYLFRKPVEGTTTANFAAHGTGGINVDGCRIGVGEGDERAEEESKDRRYNGEGATEFWFKPGPRGGDARGRWPANIIHDGSAEVMQVFPASDGQSGAVTGEEPSAKINAVYGNYNGRTASTPRGDSGSAARFFFCAKASREDREEGLEAFAPKQRDEGRDDDADGANNPRNRSGQLRRNHHPTVKNTQLMRWLCRLVTPSGGTILDPFAGSGSTGKAAVLERLGFVGIEQDAQFCEIARARIAWAESHRRPDQLSLLGEEVA